MNNEIGRKITSLTLMTIMIAGGMTIAVPGMMPAAHAANANLFVSAENSQFDNYMSGPQVIEVVIIDSDINDTDEAKGEPDLTVNGSELRMIQNVDGNWYGYFADVDMAITADATTTTPGQGLDFGTVCTTPGDLAAAEGFIGDAAPFSLGDTDGVAINQTTCAGGTDATINVLREAKDINDQAPTTGDTNPPDVNQDAWPFIQLYDLNPTGNVVVQYNKGGGVQTTTLTFDTVDQFAGASLDRSVYTPGSQVHATITDLWLNIDPTDEDSWTFSATTGDPHYQVFNENGGAPGDSADNTDGSLAAALDDLMCEDNCRLVIDVNTQAAANNVLTLQDNNDSQIVAPTDADDAEDWETAGTNLSGAVPVTITEQGPNSGIFGTYDEADVSNLLVLADAARGTSGTVDYNETPVTVLVGLAFATIDMQPVDDEWSSGESIPVELIDNDANKNSRADEDLDFNNPEVDLIPALKIGSPVSFFDEDEVIGGTIFSNPGGSGTLEIVELQPFSDRAILEASSGSGVDGETVEIPKSNSVQDLFDVAPVNDETFQGFALLNWDFRSLANEGNFDSLDSIDLDINGELVADDADLQGLVIIDDTTDGVSTFGGMSASDPLVLTVTLNCSGPGVPASCGAIPTGTLLPMAADLFGFGFTDDGLQTDERINNHIVRLELEETGDNTGIFEGELEYTMINQLNILDGGLYEGLSTFADDPTFIVSEDFTDEDSPRVNYFDRGADGVSTQIADQEEAPSHSGIVSFDLDTYKVADTVNITLEDQDLNVDSDLIDIFTTVPGDFADPVANMVGEAGLPVINDFALGRLLDVTLDDQLWSDATDECLDALDALGVDTGLSATGFTLIETEQDSGVFIGDFQIPQFWCRAGADEPESSTGLDLETNYVDFRDASGEVIEVGDSAGIRANTGSISLDRTVYPVPFGVPKNFGTLTGETSPDNRSFFPIHATGINDDLTVSGSFLNAGDLSVHIRINDPDFDISASGEDQIAQDTAALPIGPVKVSVIRGSETVILGFAGGESPNPDGRINVGTSLAGDGMVSTGEVVITDSTGGFGGVVTSGSPAAFTDGAVSVDQGSLSASATFTDNASNGIDSGNELSSFSGVDLASFSDGQITITQGSNTVAAIFTDSGAPGLGSGSEISGIATFATGSVLVCQTTVSPTCATGTFLNIGTTAINAGELDVSTSIDVAGTLPTIVELDDSVTGSGTATATAEAGWNDFNNDTNVDDGELTILVAGAGYTTGDTLEIVDPAGPTVIGTAVYTDSEDTLETDELTISPDPSGSGFVNGEVVIFTNPPTSGVSANGIFTDDPVVRQFGAITEIAPDAGIFELDLTIKYTDGPADQRCPETVDFNLNTAGNQGELTRFNAAAPAGENYCILQGDILQVEYTDPADASGDVNTVTDSATFDLRNGVLQSDKSVYIIGSDMILTLIEPDLDLDNDSAETWDLDLIEWDSDAATVTMGNADGEGAAFDPEPSNFRETGDSTGIFQIVIEIPEELQNDKLERGEEIILEYTDWGPSGSDFVGDEDEDVNLTLYTSNFGATVELDQKVYTWTDKVYVTVVAPDHNFDSDLVDEIGNTDLDPIKVSTRGSDLDNYKLVETGTDTGIFTGEVILTGFTHDADGDTTTGDSNGNDVTSRSPSGVGPTDGLLPADDDDGITVSFEFSEDETVVGSALIRWNIGEVQWLEASYPASGTGVVRVIDPDMNLDPEAVDNFDVDAWSDSDAGGIDLTVTETNEATGIFEGTVFFTVTDESSGHRLRVAEGDTVTAEYEDNTLPDPYTTADELDITATSLIGTIVPPLERAPIASCRVVDAFGNTLSSVSVDQQVQITCDVSNGQDREQPFAYLVQVQNSDGVTVQLAWITGSLTAGQSFSPSLSWIPLEAGAYEATSFVWESVDNPTALSPPVTTPITVN